jgi:hypothetical protein
MIKILRIVALVASFIVELLELLGPLAVAA